jgi:hypothetical protein
MSATKKSSSEVFTVSTKSGNSSGEVFESYSLPNGKTAHVLDRRVYERALKRADGQMRQTLDVIRKLGGNLEE